MRTARFPPLLDCSPFLFPPVPNGFWIPMTTSWKVDISALVKNLKSRHLGGAAVDVYPSEPKANGKNFEENELRNCPNTILTPHIGTEGGNDNDGPFFCLLRGQKLWSSLVTAADQNPVLFSQRQAGRRRRRRR
ncbi:MAG: hypothetical protein BJ554DRAFT_4513 [Olpidium bornovanus]|uniref:D-isomer specific 2-hydroxyacid dehydrogenase NAD-binding domain-containing protein n=1 Tax=Olpidium bornovanus TaxID=278681 RepID=A0A8H7ZMJ0_9FUNG|nr:MAG: hypothetical protein BJ554DRAFT_4513 [Olpidium bornovanus]